MSSTGWRSVHPQPSPLPVAPSCRRRDGGERLGTEWCNRSLDRPRSEVSRGCQGRTAFGQGLLSFPGPGSRADKRRNSWREGFRVCIYPPSHTHQTRRHPMGGMNVGRRVGGAGVESGATSETAPVGNVDAEELREAGELRGGEDPVHPLGSTVVATGHNRCRSRYGRHRRFAGL